MKAEIVVSQFIMSHGKLPRGTGYWAFAATRNASGESVKQSPQMTYSDAKKWAREQFKGAPVIYLQS